MFQNEKGITYREFRTMLFDLDKQSMTVQELRTLLFEVDDQDAPVRPFWDRNARQVRATLEPTIIPPPVHYR